MDYPHRLPYRKIYRAAKVSRKSWGKEALAVSTKVCCPEAESRREQVELGTKVQDSKDGKLGDFGRAKLYDHGTNPKSTHVVGSLGYMASELPRTSKSKMSSDVYSYGSLLLEVACGRRLIEPGRPSEEMILVEL
ncbi:L-type lectin-domain containing receptor kinase IV.1, partial [Nymphaea colorata]|uniref:L-type lectin-domain containing receptor kinase IV.1 n=1 Tax=Nymphaea colorata TaxID=210225 RepID=UPI00129E5A5C